MTSSSKASTGSIPRIEAARRVAIKAVAAAVPIIAAIVTPLAHAGENDGTPRHFACIFDKGNSGGFEAGKFQSAEAAPLSFEVGDIDLDKQTATLIIDGKKSGTLRVVRALNANHYLEVANEGFLNLTTIYDLDPAAGFYPAVHSRHFGLMGQPVFSQYWGRCTAKS